MTDACAWLDRHGYHNQRTRVHTDSKCDRNGMGTTDQRHASRPFVPHLVYRIPTGDRRKRSQTCTRFPSARVPLKEQTRRSNVWQSSAISRNPPQRCMSARVAGGDCFTPTEGVGLVHHAYPAAAAGSAPSPDCLSHRRVCRHRMEGTNGTLDQTQVLTETRGLT